MNKQGSTIYNLSFFKDFLRNKLNLTICSVSAFALLIGFLAFFKKEPLYFFPDRPNTQVVFYNDKNDGGNSIIFETKVTDTCLFIRFILKDGFIQPYVGISIENNLIKKQDISAYNRMEISASGDGVKSIFVYLVLKDSTLYLKENAPGFRQLSQYIPVNSIRSTFKLKMNNFRTPDWWFDKYNIPPTSSAKPDFKHIQGISVATGLTPQLNQQQSFKVYSIKFYNNYTMEICIMLFMQLLVISILLTIFYFRHKPQKELKPLTINYVPVSIPEKNGKETGFLDYINNNFHNAELNLDLISKQTGYSQRTISEGISSQFQCNVKTYINQIRVNEAMRLLKETDLNISEIAYRVGFSSPSNFNRVFKNLTGKIPSNFLQTKD